MKQLKEQTLQLCKDDIINLRDSVLQSPYFREIRWRSSSILELFFARAIGAKSSVERGLTIEDVMKAYAPKIVDETTARTQLKVIMTDHLPGFFVAVGKHLPVKAEIVKDRERVGIWYLEFSTNDPTIGDCVSGFWHQHFKEKENLLVLSEALFFADQRGNIVRNRMVNDPAERKELHPFAGKQVESMEPTYYVNGGQVKAAFMLAELFQDHGAKLELESGLGGLSDRMTETNLVLFGNPRTNAVLATLQEQGGFRLNVGERSLLDDGKHLDDKIRLGSRGTCYQAILTRCANFDGRHVITAICSNHGRSVAAIAAFVSRQAHLADFYKGLRLPSASEPLPSRFQVLFKVALNEGAVLGIEIEKIHRYSSRPSLVGGFEARNNPRATRSTAKPVARAARSAF
jgi:hypothetical protein